VLQVSLSQASTQSRDEEEEEAPAADDSLVQPCTSSTTSQAKKARKAGSALADVLTRFLEQTRQEDLDAASQVILIIILHIILYICSTCCHDITICSVLDEVSDQYSG
jgi:hypothetical protein